MYANNSTFISYYQTKMQNQADMNGKDYFVFRRLFQETGKSLPDDMRLRYYDALVEYGLYWIEPDDMIIKSLITGAMYSIDKTDERRKRKSEYMKWNKNAVKNFEKVSKQRKTEQNRDGQIEDIEDIEDIKNNKKDLFELFRKEYPHARKWKKKDSMMYFSKQNPQEVMQQVSILKWKLKAWLVEAQFIPACERWIRDFTPISEDVVKQDLYKICRWHLNCGWDIKQRATELKQTFGDEQINEIVKAIQQKNKPLF